MCYIGVIRNCSRAAPTKRANFFGFNPPDPAEGAALDRRDKRFSRVAVAGTMRQKPKKSTAGATPQGAKKKSASAVRRTPQAARAPKRPAAPVAKASGRAKPEQGVVPGMTAKKT